MTRPSSQSYQPLVFPDAEHATAELIGQTVFNGMRMLLEQVTTLIWIGYHGDVPDDLLPPCQRILSALVAAETPAELWALVNDALFLCAVAENLWGITPMTHPIEYATLHTVRTYYGAAPSGAS